MTYPESRYSGDDGETSATLRNAAAPADLVFRSSGNRVHYLATGGSTDGLFGLYRWEMSAARTGADPHFHRTFSESFYILSGTVKVYDGRAWTDARPGDFLHVPPGGIHAFRNESDEPASMLILFAPGAPREAYFEGLPGMAKATAEERETFIRAHDQFAVPDDDGA